jgi:aspartate kinase
MKVFKFGGASVKDANAVINVGEILTLYAGQKIIVVVSAMGKTTNKLEEILNSIRVQDRTKFEREIDELRAYHHAIMHDLFKGNEFSIFQKIEEIIEGINELYSNNNKSEKPGYLYDQIVSLGELLSSHIVNDYLVELGKKSSWLDARKMIRTDERHQEANVDWEKSKELIQLEVNRTFIQSDIVLTQGFIGHTADGSTTTLGREGSDYSAGIFAYCCDAENVTIWKDVPGMLNADPKYFQNTKKLEKISFKEAIELSYYGASVIHPKTIKPLQNKNIPLFVKSFIEPLGAGTEIQSETKDDGLIASFIIKQEQVLFSITPKDFSFIDEQNLHGIFELLAKEQIKINLMQNSALSFSILVDAKKVSIPELLSVLKNTFNVKYNDNLELVTIRHYNTETIESICRDKIVIIEQKTRHTARFVLKTED